MAYITSISRFKRTSLIKTRTGKDTYGRIEGFDQIKFINERNYSMYIVEAGFDGRPDLIAAEFYGDPQLEWVIVIANRPKNPLNWPEIGESIKIPNSAWLRGIL